MWNPLERRCVDTLPQLPIQVMPEGCLVRQDHCVESLEPAAYLGSKVATGLLEVSNDPNVLDGEGRWAVVVTFEGEPLFARFEHWSQAGSVAESVAGSWDGPVLDAWSSSLDEHEYRKRVDQLRQEIAKGVVYQVNLCRTLTAELPSVEPFESDVAALAQILSVGNPSLYSGFIRLPDYGVELATASPELLLRRSGDVLESGPIKGTSDEFGDFPEKDRAENIMIVDLVRNDLGRVCEAGTVHVPRLLSTESIPGGITHLVSYIRGTLTPETSWREVLAALLPAGSVSGAPKSSALRLIEELEPAPRGLYCGAIGWVDADTGEAELAVGIRTFWITSDAGRRMLNFGTGAGITWGSDAEQEWRETELKARHLTALASNMVE